MLLDSITKPSDVRALSYEDLEVLAREIRDEIVEAVSRNGGHLGSNLGAVELTLAVHRVFDSPRDIVLWDTGHQAYVHKMLTGRRADFATLRQEGGLSGYPSRAESEHDWIENSHASPVVSYAHGLATAQRLRGQHDRHIVAVLGDGSLTGGMAYEGLNNLGHSGSKAIIILNDNGRSYAPTVSKLGESLARLRANPSYIRNRARLDKLLHEVPVVGGKLEKVGDAAFTALREIFESPAFFETLGVRYTGPVRRPRRRRRSSGRCATPPSTTGRSSSTCSRRRAGATSPPRPTRSSACTTCPTPSRAATPRRSPRRSSRRPTTGPTWSPSPRRCPTPPACCRSRSGSPTGSSTSASPSSTRSRPPPAWRWAGCGRSSPSTRRSSAGRSTRSTSTWRCTASRSCSASTGPASPATTAPATTACSTWCCSPRCRA